MMFWFRMVCSSCRIELKPEWILWSGSRNRNAKLMGKKRVRKVPSVALESFVYQNNSTYVYKQCRMIQFKYLINWGTQNEEQNSLRQVSYFVEWKMLPILLIYFFFSIKKAQKMSLTHKTCPLYSIRYSFNLFCCHGTRLWFLFRSAYVQKK